MSTTDTHGTAVNVANLILTGYLTKTPPDLHGLTPKMIAAGFDLLRFEGLIARNFKAKLAAPSFYRLTDKGQRHIDEYGADLYPKHGKTNVVKLPRKRLKISA